MNYDLIASTVIELVLFFIKSFLILHGLGGFKSNSTSTPDDNQHYGIQQLKHRHTKPQTKHAPHVHCEVKETIPLHP